MTANDATEFWIAYSTLAKVGMCDGPGATESLRVYQEWGDAGCPRPVEDFIYRRANIRSDGTEPPLIVADNPPLGTTRTVYSQIGNRYGTNQRLQL